MTTYLFIKPLDVLFLRGNEAFGGEGQHAESLMPPWPSVFAGALRSAILARDPQVELGLFSELTEEGDVRSEVVRKVVGTPRKPGSFRISFLSLGTAQEVFFPVPSDVLVWEDKNGGPNRQVKKIVRLAPVDITNLVPEDFARSKLPFSWPHALSHVVTAKTPKEKPSSGWWLNQEGLSAYLRGETLSEKHVVHSSELWEQEFRLGIARSRESFTVEEGRIYTSVAVALKPKVGFVIGVEGVERELLREIHVLRLGGDGRGAEVGEWGGALPEEPQTDGNSLAVCATPCVSPLGWLPPGIVQDSGALKLGGAQLVAAKVGRSQCISGWDLAAHQPKPAQSFIPQGSVFYFRGALPDGQPFLWGLASWLGDVANPNPAAYVWWQRLAEGFNRTLKGAWPKQP